MSGRQRGKTVVVLEERKAAPSAPARARTAPAVEPDALYGVALMKAALELKRRPEGTVVEDVLREVIARMRLPQAEFFAWLEQRGGLQGLAGSRRR